MRRTLLTKLSSFRLFGGTFAILASSGCGTSPSSSEHVEQTAAGLTTSGPATFAAITGAEPFNVGTDISSFCPSNLEVQVTAYNGTGAAAAAPTAPNTSVLSPPYNFGTLPGDADQRIIAGSNWNEIWSQIGTNGQYPIVTGAAVQALTNAQDVGMEDTANPQGYLLGSISFGASNWASILKSLTNAPSWITALQINVTSTPSDFRGYPPTRGRWISQEWIPGSGYSALGLYDILQTYTPPLALSDLRERGARMYCAAKSVQKAQNGIESTLAEHSAAHFTIFGQTIQLWTLAQKVSVGTPQKFDGGAGAQAFAVPVNFGTRIAPIQINGDGGYLGELITPVVFVSGDSEIVNLADLQNIPVLIDNSYVSPATPEYVKQYQTTTHGDAIYIGGGGGLSYSKTVNLATFWLFTLKLGVGISASHGKINWGGDSNTLDGVLNNTVFTGAIPERYGYATVNPLTSWAYHDGGWTEQSSNNPAIAKVVPESICYNEVWRMQLGTANDPDTSWRFPGPGVTCGAAETVATGMDIRAYMDDDHSFSIDDNIAVTGTLGVSAGISVGDPTGDGIDISLTVQGGVTAQADFYQMVRDGVVATKSPSGTVSPAAGITVRPRTVTQLDLNPPSLVANFKVHLDLPIFGETSVSFSENILPWGSAPTPIVLAKSDSDTSQPPVFTENNYLRMLTGGLNGDPTNQPTVNSHLPGGAEFASFPESVASCLADATPPPPAPVPPPPDPTNPDPTPASFNMCIYQTTRNTVSCSTIDTVYPVSGGAQDVCYNSYYHFLCSGTYTQPNGQIYHLWDPSNAAQMSAYTNVLTACAPAATASGTLNTTTLTNVAQAFTQLAACDANANPVYPTSTATQVY